MAGRRVLIVEDEHIVQLHLSKIVSDLGYEVTGLAATTVEALESAAGQPPDLALMDIRLDGPTDGIETAKLLREKHDLAVVFLTAYADEQTIARTREAGAAGYIVKPFAEAQVRAALATALSTHDSVRELHARQKSLTEIIDSSKQAVVFTDRRGSVALMSARAGELSGCCERAAVGKKLRDILQVSENAGLKTFDDAWSKALSERTPTTFDDVMINVRGAWRRVGGTVEPVEAAADDDSEVIVFLNDNTLRKTVAPRHVSAKRPFGNGTRLLIYSHDTFGLGHLQRSLNIARALVSKYPDLSILIVTGSAVVHRYKLPPGVDYVKLPAVRKVASEQYEARLLRISDEGVLRLRTNLLLRTVQDYEPHMLLVDHAPIGMKGEMLPAIEWLRENQPSCIHVLGLRDIIDDPQAVIRHWSEQDMHATLEKYYDHILVYGTKDVFDPTTAYQFSETLRQRTHFINYITDLESKATNRESLRENKRPLVAVSIGGGDGAAELVIGNYFGMLEELGDDINFDSVILPGPLAAPEFLTRMAQMAKGLPVKIEEFVQSTSPYFRRADLVISTGGYNTVGQLLAHANRAVIIPRMLHRREQLMRAECLGAMGLVSVIRPEQVTPKRLGEVIRSQLSDPREPLVEGRRDQVLKLDGTTRLVDFCETLQVSCVEQAEAAHE